MASRMRSQMHVVSNIRSTGEYDTKVSNKETCVVRLGFINKCWIFHYVVRGIGRCEPSVFPNGGKVRGELLCKKATVRQT